MSLRKRGTSKTNMSLWLSLSPDEEKTGQWNWNHITLHGKTQTWKLEFAPCRFALVKTLKQNLCLFVCCCVTMTMTWRTYDRGQGPHRCCPDNRCPRHTSSALGCSGCSCRQTRLAGTGAGARRRGWLQMSSWVRTETDGPLRQRLSTEAKQSFLYNRSALIPLKVAKILVEGFSSFSSDLAKTVYSIACKWKIQPKIL